MTIDLKIGYLVKVRGYQRQPNGGLKPVYSICEVVETLDDRVRVCHHYPNNPDGWDLPFFTVAIENILPPF